MALPATGQNQPVNAEQRRVLRDFKPITVLPKAIETSDDANVRALLERSRNSQLPQTAWVSESADGNIALGVPVGDTAGHVLRRSADGHSVTVLWDVISRDRVIYADVDADADTTSVTRFALRDSQTREGIEFDPEEKRIYRLTSKASMQSAASGTIACIISDLGTLAYPCEASILVANMAACVAGIAALPETAGLSAIFAIPSCGTVLGTLEQSLLCAGTDCGLQAAINAGATVVQAIVSPQTTSLQLPSGAQYIWGMVTGGGAASSPFTNGQLAAVTDTNGNMAAALATGTDNTNSFSTNTTYHTIGGVAISGNWNLYGALTSANSQSGASGVSASITLTEQSLVVVIATASSQEQIQLQLSGGSSLQVDASSTNTSGEVPMVIAHAFLAPGSYTITETSSVGNLQGQNVNNMADLMGVFIFGGE